jgi:hypothetical protein
MYAVRCNASVAVTNSDQQFFYRGATWTAGVQLANLPATTAEITTAEICGAG